MKKWMALLAIALVIAGSWYYLRTYYRVEPAWNEAKFGKVTKTDIRVPITATGIIEPWQKIDIKPEASGQLVSVPVKEGDFVKNGDKLCIILKEDEQRNYDSATARVEQIVADLERVRASVDAARAAVDSAQARLDNLRALRKRIEFDFKRTEEMTQQQLTNEQERVYAQANLDMNEADVKAAEVAVISAKAQLLQAIAQEKGTAANLKDAQNQKDLSKLHLDRTDVINQVEGVVTQVLVKKGMVVQSATGSFTGGTPLMTVSDVSQLKVTTRVDEADIGRVRDISPLVALPKMPGLIESLEKEEADKLAKRIGTVKLTVDAFPELTFEGKIDRVDPEGRLNSGSAIIQYDVQVTITDSRRYMLPLGAQATVEFTVENVKDATAVPAEAVKSDKGLRGVYVKTPPPQGSTRKFGKRFVPCRFGITDGSVTEVVSSDEPLNANSEVFTKLPVEKEDS